MAENTLTKEEVDDRIETGIAFVVIALMTALGAYLMLEGDATIDTHSSHKPALTTLDDGQVLPRRSDQQAPPSAVAAPRDREPTQVERLNLPAAAAIPALTTPVIAPPIEALAKPAAPAVPAPAIEEVKVPGAIEPSAPAVAPSSSEIFKRVEPPAAVTEPIAEPIAEPIPEPIAEPALTVVEAAPAPVAAEVSLEESAVLAEATSRVSFVVASAILTEDSKAVLDKIAALLSARPGTRLRVTGFTDNQGEIDNNLALSFARAEACREYLLANGVAVGQVDSLGMGERQPVADNATAEGRAQNRRVEFTLLTNP